jgi:hypothetical protein
MFRFIDKLPLAPIALGALLLGLAPFASDPHLVVKLKMLFEGALFEPMDIFDLCMHGCLPVLLLIKLARLRGRAEQ